MDLKAARNARSVEQSTSQAGTSASDPGPASEPVSRFASLDVGSRTLDALVALLDRVMEGIDALTIARGLNEFRGKIPELQNRLVDLQHHFSRHPMLTFEERASFSIMNHDHGALSRLERIMRHLNDVLKSAEEDGEPDLILERLESSMGLETPGTPNLHLVLIESIDHLNSQASIFVNGNTRALELAVYRDILYHDITAQSNIDIMRLSRDFPYFYAPSFEDVYSLILEACDRGRQEAVEPLLNLRSHYEGPKFLQKAQRE